MDRTALAALKRMTETHLYIRGLVGWLGFCPEVVEYDRPPRQAGSTKYSLAKMVRLAMDGIISFSFMPLRAAFIAAFILMTPFLLYLVYNILLYTFFNVAMVPGWSSLILAVILFGTFNLLTLGILGEHTGRIYSEVKRRPIFFSTGILWGKYSFRLKGVNIIDSSRELREKAFYDEWAEQTPLANTKALEAFENLTAQENRFIISRVGDLNGFRLLDIGSGLGESSVYVALQGAKVTANDIRCVALAQSYDASISTLLSSPSAGFDFGENQFDIVYAANVLHPIGPIKPFLDAVKRSLTPQGRFFFFDPLTYNPVINVYHRMATVVRTEDERPLKFSDLKYFRKSFSEVHHREFWLSTLLIFLKSYIVDRIDPNADRYWKRILNEDPNLIGWWFGPLQRLDNLLLHIPPLQFLAWNMVIWGRK